MKIPPKYLHTITGYLKKGKYIETIRGKNGGFRIVEPADEISLYDIVTLLEPEKQSPIITSFLYPEPGFSFTEFYGLLKQQGFVIYPGKVSDADTFRIGTIGDVFPEDFERLTQAVAAIRQVN